MQVLYVCKQVREANTGHHMDTSHTQKTPSAFCETLSRLSSTFIFYPEILFWNATWELITLLIEQIVLK